MADARESRAVGTKAGRARPLSGVLSPSDSGHEPSEGASPGRFRARGRWADAAFHQEHVYPIAQAVPSLVVVILFYLVLVQFDPNPSRLLRTAVGILSLTVLMLPSATALWLNGILRVLDREYVRVARARG